MVSEHDHIIKTWEEKCHVLEERCKHYDTELHEWERKCHEWEEKYHHAHKLSGEHEG